MKIWGVITCPIFMLSIMCLKFHNIKKVSEMSQYTNLGCSCQISKPLEEGSKFVEQKTINKTLRVFGVEVFNIQYF